MLVKSLTSITALLIAAALLYAGNGLQGTLLALRGGLEGFSPTMVGILMSSYYFGFILGCRQVPGVIAAVGHIRCFVALASVASASALAHALFVDVASWAMLRVITGFAFAGMAMVLESWINERATNENRGRILSVYRIVDLSSLTVGNLLLATASPDGFSLFALVSILISLSLVPVAMTRSKAPVPVAAPRLNVAGLYRISPVAAACAVVTGLANSAFWGVAPLFVQAAGFEAAVVGTFMSTAIVGAVVSQLPIGIVSDRLDRRLILSAVSILAAVAAIAIALFGMGSQTALLVTAGLFGAFALPVFGLGLAHAADHAAPGNAVSTSGSMLLLHGCGAVAGAVIGGAAMNIANGAGLFFFIAIAEASLAIFAIVRLAVRDAPERKGAHVPAPRSPSTMVYRKR